MCKSSRIGRNHRRKASNYWRKWLNDLIIFHRLNPAKYLTNEFFGSGQTIDGRTAGSRIGFDRNWPWVGRKVKRTAQRRGMMTSGTCTLSTQPSHGMDCSYMLLVLGYFCDRSWSRQKEERKQQRSDFVAKLKRKEKQKTSRKWRKGVE